MQQDGDIGAGCTIAKDKPEANQATVGEQSVVYFARLGVELPSVDTVQLQAECIQEYDPLVLQQALQLYRATSTIRKGEVDGSGALPQFAALGFRLTLMRPA